MPTALDPAHPAFAFIQAVWPFDEGTGTPQELIGSAPVTVDAGSFTWTLESGRWGITLTTADIIGLGADRYPTAPDITIVIRKRKTDGTARLKCVFGYAGDSAGTTRRCSAIMPSDDLSTIIFDFGGTSSGTSRLLISGQTFNQTLDTFVIRVNASEIRIWRNGTDIGHTTGGAPPTRVNNGTNSQINNGDNLGGDNQFVNLFAIYTGDDLTDAMCASLSSNPDAMFLHDPVFDEYGPPTQLIQAPQRPPRSTLLWYAPDELPPAAPVAKSDETGWPLPRPLMVHRITTPRPWSFDADELPGPVPPPVLTVLVEVVGQDQFTTPRLVALVQVEGRASAVPQPVLTVLVPVGYAAPVLTVTVLSIARDANDDPVTDARDRRILVPVGPDEVA